MFGDTFKNFSINFNAANETGHFSSGDLLSGRVFFQLTKESKITSITMDVEGKAHIHWSTSGGGKKRRRRHFSAKLEFFKIKILFLQESPVGGTTTLQAGTHEYPFSCQLPHGDFPSSFCGVNGQITYTVKVGIKRPWHLTKDFVSEFKFMSHLDTNQPELRSPLSGTNTTTPGCLWCAAGPITMTASSEKKAFIPGETVKIICKFSNASSRTVTPKLRLKQKQGFYTLRKENQRVVFKYLAALTGNPISAHTSGVHTEFSLTVPSTAPLTISNCSILEVEYVIEVKLSIPFSYSLEVLIPIILCGTRVDIDPPPYITENFPSTFHGVHGRITYTLKVGIYRPWHMSKDFVTELNFVNHINANQPVLWVSLAVSCCPDLTVPFPIILCDTVVNPHPLQCL